MLASNHVKHEFIFPDFKLTGTKKNLPLNLYYTKVRFPTTVAPTSLELHQFTLNLSWYSETRELEAKLYSQNIARADMAYRLCTARHPAAFQCHTLMENNRVQQSYSVRRK